MVMLMLIGGAPGSTAGGMKMTTIAVLLLSTAAVFRRKKTPSVWQTYSNGNRAVCGSSYADVYGALYSGRTVFMLCRRTACAHKFV